MNQKLNDIVKRHRKLSGLTQAQVAKLAGVGKTVVYDIEHGKESVQYDTLMKVLRVLNVSISFQSPLSSSGKNPPG